MAFTIGKVHQTVFGDLRTVVLSCSVDSASGNIDTGLTNVYGMAFAAASMATAGIMLRRNVGSGATARPGIVNINSAANGDAFILTVFGK